MTSKLISHEFTVNRKQKFSLGAWPTCHPSSRKLCQLGSGSLLPGKAALEPRALLQDGHWPEDLTKHRFMPISKLYNSFLYYIKTGNITVSSVAKSISHTSIPSLEAFLKYKVKDDLNETLVHLHLSSTSTTQIFRNLTEALFQVSATSVLPEIRLFWAHCCNTITIT